MRRLDRETIARFLGGIGIALVLCTGGIVRDVFAQKPRPKPTEESILIDCRRCWDAFPDWWCRLWWDCPPKPDDPPPQEGGDAATVKKPVTK